MNVNSRFWIALNKKALASFETKALIVGTPD